MEQAGRQAYSLECGDLRRFLSFFLGNTSRSWALSKKKESGGNRRTPKIEPRSLVLRQEKAKKRKNQSGDARRTPKSFARQQGHAWMIELRVAP
jgi:hypothetical protein